MAPRAYWKGYLKLSLVSCPIALFPATSEREKISFHQLNKKTGNRIKYRKVDADTGDEVEAADIIKGYEVGKGEYIELEPEELEAVAIESKRTIEIDEFVPQEGDRRALSQQPLLHRAGRRGRPAGVRRDPRSHPQGGHGRARQGRVHLARAHHRAGSARQGHDGRHAALSVRGAQGRRTISTTLPTRKSRRTCSTWPRTSSRPRQAHFEPEKFEDRYEDALKDLLKKKQTGEKIEAPREREPSNVVNLMDALRRSVETERGGERRKPARAAGNARAPKKAGRSSARAKKAG